MKEKNKLVNRKKLGSPVKKEYAEKLKQLSAATMIAQSNFQIGHLNFYLKNMKINRQLYTYIMLY